MKKSGGQEYGRLLPSSWLVLVTLAATLKERLFVVLLVLLTGLLVVVFRPPPPFDSITKLLALVLLLSVAVDAFGLGLMQEEEAGEQEEQQEEAMVVLAVQGAMLLVLVLRTAPAPPLETHSIFLQSSKLPL